MIETYDELNKLNNLDINDESKLVEMYKNDENRSDIIIKLYCDNIGYLRNRAMKYCSVDEEDKASFALEAIHDALMIYEDDYDGGMKLISFIGIIFERKLKNELARENRDVRILNKEAQSLDEMIENEDYNFGVDSKLIKF